MGYTFQSIRNKVILDILSLSFDGQDFLNTKNGDLYQTYLTLIVLGGGNLHHVSVLTSLLVKRYFFFQFELKLQVFVMTKGHRLRLIYAKDIVRTWEIFFLYFASHGVNSPPPLILLGLKMFYIVLRIGCPRSVVHFYIVTILW